MSEYKYSVVMSTPLGKKYGMLTVSVSDNKLNGQLNILRHTHPLEGTVDSLGNCKITGTITTLMRRIPFEAEGRLTASAVAFSIHDERNVFELTGVAEQRN